MKNHENTSMSRRQELIGAVAGVAGFISFAVLPTAVAYHTGSQEMRTQAEFADQLSEGSGAGIELPDLSESQYEYLGSLSETYDDNAERLESARDEFLVLSGGAAALALAGGFYVSRRSGRTNPSHSPESTQ